MCEKEILEDIKDTGVRDHSLSGAAGLLFAFSLIKCVLESPQSVSFLIFLSQFSFFLE